MKHYTMKLLFSLTLLVQANAFVPECGFGRTTTARLATKNWLDDFLSKPFQTHGSGEKEHDKMYETQQRVLRERRQHFSKKDLRKKYHDSPNHLGDIALHGEDPAIKNKREDEAMYVDEDSGIKLPFFKTKRQLKP